MHITFKLEKAEILEKTISYIKALQDLTEDVKADCETESLEAKGESTFAAINGQYKTKTLNSKDDSPD